MAGEEWLVFSPRELAPTTTPKPPVTFIHPARGTCQTLSYNRNQPFKQTSEVIKMRRGLHCVRYVTLCQREGHCLRPACREFELLKAP